MSFALTTDGTLAQDAVDGHQDSSADVENSAVVSSFRLLSSTCPQVNKSLTFQTFCMILTVFASSHTHFSVAGKVVVYRKAQLSRN